MTHFNKLPYWETDRRISDLENFREDVIAYVDATRTEPTFGRRVDTDESRAMKPSINMAIDRIRKTVLATGINTSIYYREAPVAGGRAYDLDVISNVLSLTEFQIPYDTATGLLERAIGVYKDDLPKAKRRTFNPFWWVGKVLTWFSHVPFAIIGKAGFDAGKAEGSLVGKFISLIFYLIPIAAGLLAILDRLGFLDETKVLLGIS